MPQSGTKNLSSGRLAASCLLLGYNLFLPLKRRYKRVFTFYFSIGLLLNIVQKELENEMTELQNRVSDGGEGERNLFLLSSPT
jgi:hypothetical protein